MSKKVLVTGATGFIGRHSLIPLIARGYEVHAVSFKAHNELAAENTLPESVTWHKANLLSSANVENLISTTRPDNLLHFAWEATPGTYWTSHENLRWVQASLNLLEEFVRWGGSRVVIAGSCAEYDWNYGYCSESLTPKTPATLYGTCKHALHLMVEAFAAKQGFSQAWGRLFYLYGSHEHPKRLVASVIRSLMQGKTARCSHGEQIRDYLHVADAAEAFVRLLTSDVSGAVNIASGQPVAVKRIVATIGEKLNRSDWIEWGALPVPPNEAPLIVANTERLKQEVGWSPRYNLDAGLDHAIQWWQAEQKHRTCEEVETH